MPKGSRNAVDPGFRDTDLAGVPMPGAGDPSDGGLFIAQTAMATDSSTGGFSREGVAVAW